MSPLRVAIAGLGTVGSAVVEGLLDRADELERVAGRRLELVAISARRRRESKVSFVANPLDFVKREDVDVVVELIGGEEGIARDLVFSALREGKHVVSANKALLAKHGMSLARLAEERSLCLSYEAAIAGGLPVVKLLRENLTVSPIERVSGILNGTSNYILCRMAERRQDFAEALAEARALGFTEADPHFDISGEDAAHKLMLLMSLAFHCGLVEVSCQGIEKLQAIDMRLAGELGYAIRLIAYGEKRVEGVYGFVRPLLVSLDSHLARSAGTDNVIGLYSPMRHIFLEGEGAGAQPTASSVIADLVDIARGFMLPPFGRPVASLSRQKVFRPSIDSAFYIRAFAKDRAGSMAAITNIMAARDISLSGVSQPPLSDEAENLGQSAPIALMTHKTAEEKVDRALEELVKLEAITELPLAIQIER